MKLTYLNRQSRSKRKRKGINTINFGSLLLLVLFFAWVTLLSSSLWYIHDNNNHNVLPISSTSITGGIIPKDDVISNHQRNNYHTTDEHNYQSLQSPIRSTSTTTTTTTTSTNTSSSTLIKKKKKKKKTLHLYFINLDESTDRAAALNKNIASLSWKNSPSTFQLHRVPAVTVNDVKELYKHGSLYLKQVEEGNLNENGNITDAFHTAMKLVDSAQTSEDIINTFTFHEVLACTLSHLRAIKQAYDDGQEMAIILEDDALISQDFLDNWESYADQAPSDWQILQWMTSNTIVNKRAIHTHHDFWMSWRWYFWRANFYSIRREGMERIMDASYEKSVKMRSNLGYDTMTTTTTTSSSSSTTHGTDRWVLSIPQFITADSFIFDLTKTYTSTYPWITLQNCSNTIIMLGDREDCTFGKSSIATPPPMLTKSQLVAMKRPETIAIVMNLRLKDIASTIDEIQSLKVDVEVLSYIHPHSRWFVKIVLVNDSLKPFVEEIMSSHLPISGIGAMVDVHLEINRDRFNKFEFLRSILDEVKTYDYILLKDNDIVIAGFEWNTFMNAKGNSTLSSPFYEKSEEWLEENNMKRYKSHRRVNLQHTVFFNKYDDESYASPLESISTMFLEMKLVLMKSDFADWFFSQIFQSQYFLNQDISWGVDVMWCGAAYQYNIHHNNRNVNACSIVPLNILDRNTKQISKVDDFKDKGKELVKTWQHDPHFSSWFSKSNPSLIVKKLKVCQESDTTLFNMNQCGKAIQSAIVKDHVKKVA